MSEPSKDPSTDSTASETMSKVNESSNPEPASSPNSSSGGTLAERVATAEDSEPVPRQVRALPLRAKEPQTCGQRMAAETSDAKLHSKFAQMYYYWSERLRDLYRGKKYIECRQGCLLLLKSPYLPHYKRIETLQLLSSVAGSAVLARRSLREAQRRLDHLDSRKKFVQILLSENAIIMETVKAHMTADDTEENDTKDEEDELVPSMGGNILLDNPPVLRRKRSTGAVGIHDFQREVKDFYLVIEEEDDDDSIEEESDDDPVEQEDDDDPIEEERDHDPIEEALAEKREKAE
ncbi:hypothetical protein KC331_g141 [Hortaea werneckii]|nr:hypothetical protein KC331_g141 [Hortaea werneckii]KAI7721974.1 hypothetical protein KC353_g911 [Hortaea werneckii]